MFHPEPTPSIVSTGSSYPSCVAGRPALRPALVLVFIWFGALKIFGVSPVRSPRCSTPGGVTGQGASGRHHTWPRGGGRRSGLGPVGQALVAGDPCGHPIPLDLHPEAPLEGTYDPAVLLGQLGRALTLGSPIRELHL